MTGLLAAQLLSACGPLTVRSMDTTTNNTNVRRAVALLATAAATVAGLAFAGSAHAQPTIPLWIGTQEHSRLQPVEPCRITDTRLGNRLAADSTSEIDVAGLCGVPADSVAVAVTVTATAPSADGYVTLAPSDDTSVSSLNYRKGETRANGAIVELSDKGSVSVYTLAETDLIIDVTGAFVPTPADQPVASGRFVAHDARLVDTRIEGDRNYVVLKAPNGASAVAINVTIAGSSAAGFASAYPYGNNRPTASTVNTDGPGQTRAATTIVPVNRHGLFVVEQIASDGDLIVDMAGWFTSFSSLISTEGLYVPARPLRVIDTRRHGDPVQGDGPSLIGPARAAQNNRAIGLAANVTVVPIDGQAAHVTLHEGTERNLTSLVNVGPGDGAVANFGLTGVTTDSGSWGVAAGGADVHVVVDIVGWFTGIPSEDERAAWDDVALIHAPVPTPVPAD